MTGREYIGWVKRCNCVICDHCFGRLESPCDAHHVGTGDDRDDFATAALCKEHHQGSTGVHGLSRRGFYTLYKVTEIQLIFWTVKQVVNLISRNQ